MRQIHAGQRPISALALAAITCRPQNVLEQHCFVHAVHVTSSCRSAPRMTESKVLPWTLPGSSYREQRMAHGCNTMNQKVHTESNKGEEAKIKINLKINFRTKLTVRAFYLSPSTSPLGPCAEETEVRPGFHTTAGDAAWWGWLWRKLPRSRVSIKTPEADPKVSWITLAAAYCCFGFWLFGSQPMLTANDLSDRMSLFLKCFLLVYWLF